MIFEGGSATIYENNGSDLTQVEQQESCFALTSSIRKVPEPVSGCDTTDGPVLSKVTVKAESTTTTSEPMTRSSSPSSSTGDRTASSGGTSSSSTNTSNVLSDEEIQSMASNLAFLEQERQQVWMILLQMAMDWE